MPDLTAHATCRIRAQYAPYQQKSNLDVALFVVAKLRHSFCRCTFASLCFCRCKVASLCVSLHISASLLVFCSCSCSSFFVRRLFVRRRSKTTKLMTLRSVCRFLFVDAMQAKTNDCSNMCRFLLSSHDRSVMSCDDKQCLSSLRTSSLFARSLLYDKTLYTSLRSKCD